MAFSTISVSHSLSLRYECVSQHIHLHISQDFQQQKVLANYTIMWTVDISFLSMLEWERFSFFNRIIVGKCLLVLFVFKRLEVNNVGAIQTSHGCKSHFEPLKLLRNFMFVNFKSARKREGLKNNFYCFFLCFWILTVFCL